MEVKIQIAVTDNQTIVINSANLLNDLSNSLNLNIKNNDYGEDIENFIINLLIVNPPEGYIDWYKIKKPKYIEFKETKSKLTGEIMTVNKVFIVESKITGKEYEDFIISNNFESKKILTSKIIDTLSSFDLLPKKVKDFDKEKFKSDIIYFLTKNVVNN